jgi:hypothetical protein
MTGPDFRVTLFGTGVPIPTPDRSGDIVRLINLVLLGLPDLLS